MHYYMNECWTIPTSSPGSLYSQFPQGLSVLTSYSILLILICRTSTTPNSHLSQLSHTPAPSGACCNARVHRCAAGQSGLTVSEYSCNLKHCLRACNTLTWFFKSFLFNFWDYNYIASPFLLLPPILHCPWFWITNLCVLPWGRQYFSNSQNSASPRSYSIISTLNYTQALEYSVNECYNIHLHILNVLYSCSWLNTAFLKA